MNMIKRFYADIPASTTQNDGVTVPSGQVYTIIEVGGNAGFVPETISRIKFGNDVLFSTCGDSVLKELGIECYGDGEKQIKVELENKTTEVKSLGGYFRYLTS